MRLLFLDREIPKLVILFICFNFSGGKKLFKNNDDPSQEGKSTFITIRLPADVATHNQDCMYEGVVRHHGDAWSPGPCIPECRCRHGHVKCTKLECPDLNCDKPIKKKWKCCPECLPTLNNGTSCGVWSKGGNGNGGCCVFPFKYNGVMHYTCTYLDHSNPWCSISMDFDRDGVWGECIDAGDIQKSLRFKQHKGEIQQQDNATDALVSNIANNVANSASNENANLTNATVQNVTNPTPVTPESNVTTPTSNQTYGIQPTVVTPAASSNATSAAASGSIQPSTTAPIQPQASGTMGNASANASVLPSPSPSAVGPVVPQASSGIQPGSNQTVPALQTSVQPAASQSAQVGAQTIVYGPTPSLGPGASGAGATTPVLPGPAPQVTQQPAPQPTQQPQPLPSQQPAPQPVPQPAQQPQPAPVPGQPSVEGTTPGYPFPITQTTLAPGQTQVPGLAPGQAVHELTTTEIKENHNVTTTESWLGKANETLNRIPEVENKAQGGAGAQPAEANQITGGIESASSQTTRDSYNTGQGNQASYGYQAASSPYYYQDQASYNDQQRNSQSDYSSYNAQSNSQTGYPSYNTRSNSQAGYPSYNTEGNSQAGYPSYNTQSSPQADYSSYNTQSYNRYDNTAYQQYGGQASYYSNEQQYQQQYGADPGSYYTG